MDEVIRYGQALIALIAERRAAGFPVAKEIAAMVIYLANPPAEITPEMWGAHNAAQEEARNERRNAHPA